MSLLTSEVISDFENGNYVGYGVNHTGFYFEFGSGNLSFLCRIRAVHKAKSLADYFSALENTRHEEPVLVDEPSKVQHILTLDLYSDSEQTVRIQHRCTIIRVTRPDWIVRASYQQLLEVAYALRKF